MGSILKRIAACLMLIGVPAPTAVPAQTGSSAVSDSPKPKDEAEDRLWLVRARVESVTQDGGPVSVQRIVHVYDGPATLIGLRFRYYPDLVHMGPQPVPETAGIEGIWLVGRDFDGVLGTAYGEWGSAEVYYCSFPVLERESPNYASVKSLAEAVESTLKKPIEEQVEDLQRYSGLPSPDVSRWSIHRLAELESAAALKLLPTLLDMPQVPMSSQVAIDQELSRRNAGNWNSSGRRRALLWGWVCAQRSVTDYSQIMPRIRRASQSELDSQMWFDILRLAAENNRWSSVMRSSALSSMDQLRGIEAMVAKVLEYLIATVEKSPDSYLRKIAAITIGDLHLSAAQVERIRDLTKVAMDKAADEELVIALQAALKRFDESPVMTK